VHPRPSAVTKPVSPTKLSCNLITRGLRPVATGNDAAGIGRFCRDPKFDLDHVIAVSERPPVCRRSIYL